MIDVGSHVVCIKESPLSTSRWEEATGKKFISPVKGIVYTVRDVKTHDGTTGIRLIEIVNPLILPINYPRPLEPYFVIENFRLLKKLDANNYLDVKILEDA